MLKALELIGFKSFADKTRFEFPEGITVIVGPNGSGKSNIVDAIKWVLGEQSAKSLRGKEMADVIFKGTGPGGRKPAGTAEATVVFDNSRAVFAIEAPEVQITRRVYQSGEGEYLINGRPCRLRDIRDLFRGTGVGVDAYSLIEQGKVDSLLQASAKDRRAIFEEAAGISRFKAKKVEAQRRLERVEQNLLRLSDIVEEVESRLRSVRAQAAKAQRYREYSDRLQQLRTQAGVTDWRRLTGRLKALEEELDSLRAEAGEANAESESIDGRLAEIGRALDESGEQLREQQAELAGVREQLAARESAVAEARGRAADYRGEVEHCQRRLRAVSGKAGDLLAQLRAVTDALAEAESAHREIAHRVAHQQQSTIDLAAHLDHVRREQQSRRGRHLEAARTAAQLGSEVSRWQSQQASFREEEQRLSDRLESIRQASRVHVVEREASRGEEARLAEEVASQTQAMEAAEVELAESRRVLARRQQELAVLQGQQSGARQRAQVLEELEQQHAGVSAGVTQILGAAATGELPRDMVHGMVADLLEADVEVAPLVDVALGETAQHIVFRGEELLSQIEEGRLPLRGRVGLLRIDTLAPAASLRFGPLGLVRTPDLTGRPGVIGRADRLIRVREPRFQGVFQHLLGNTWFVHSLRDALSLARGAGRGLRFVATGGEVVENDGTLVVGPPLVATGIVSRRSELRDLRREILDLQQRVGQAVSEIARLQENIDRRDRSRKLLADSLRSSQAALADLRVQTRSLEQRCEAIDRESRSLEGELQAKHLSQQATETELIRCRAELAQAEAAVAGLEAELHGDERRVEQVKQRLETAQREATSAQVERAKSEQRVETLLNQQQRCQSDQRERDRAIEEARRQTLQSRQRADQAELQILRLTAEIAELYLRKEGLLRRVAASDLQRRQLSGERNERVEAQEKVRRRLRRLEEQQHRQELAAGELHHERNTLAQRLSEDYGIDISRAAAEETPEEEQQRTEIETEIQELRHRIHRIGAVNLDSLDELDDLDQRYQTLSGQFQDLTQAKESLERIIHKINADSRRLFLETLEAIRGNFQLLYRKAFGGGRADLVLEDGKDVLECGVEILATPPGKPSFNNSLLSGGEKALTAVALLLAIFQFRPSPFCILDEVDAPFDEANVGRFIDVLKDFLDWTKFVIVTHSKKTMTAATTLYGVTMQESGVSKRVSVRFEDVSEDGQISLDAVRRAEEGEQADAADSDERAA